MRVIAIDGPAGAGKSTIARAVAQALGWRYVDTGAMYRAVALAALEQGVTTEDHAALTALAAELDVRVDDDRVMLEGADVTGRVRDADVTSAVSRVAAVAGVRAAMVARQRAIAAGGRVVMEGRDIATAVLPDAGLKIFLTASIAERARRRARQLGINEDEATVAELSRSMTARDEADARRDASPFVQAPDAVVVDSTSKSLDEVVAEILSAVEETGRAVR
jgi:cytidylate kinase